MATEIERARVGRVVVEKVGGKWLVYELGPMTVHDSYLNAAETGPWHAPSRASR
jgi:hypothetical protein